MSDSIIDSSSTEQLPSIAAYHLAKIGETGAGKKYELLGKTRAELQWLADRQLVTVTDPAGFAALADGSEFDLNDYFVITGAGQRMLTFTPPMAFVLFNEREKKISGLVQELAGRGVISQLQPRVLPGKPDGADGEEAGHETARGWQIPMVVVFLGELGWGENQLRLVQAARERRKTLLPVLIGEASLQDRRRVEGLFENEDYFSLLVETPDRLEKLADRINEIAQRAAPAWDTSLDQLIDDIIHGDEGKRSAALQRIIQLSDSKKVGLRSRLREEIRGRFRPWREGESGKRFLASEKIPPARSWMLSALIWADPEPSENRSCILDHLRPDLESSPTARFWCLAGLFDTQTSYLAAAVKRGLADPDLAVAALALAIAATQAPASGRPQPV